VTTTLVETPVGATAAAAAPTGARAQRTGAPLGRASGLTLGLVTLGLSLLVLLPLAAVAAEAGSTGWSGFWAAVTAPAAVDALVLTVTSSLVVTAVNVVMGTLLAWVLVRDDFPGKRWLELVIDVPFALPTIVAGLVILSVYGRNSPVGIDLFGTRWGIMVALLFVTLPFIARTVQPTLMAFDRDTERAAATLGARPATVFRRIVLPPLVPAIAAGAALAFARAMGEYGSVLLISGGLDKTQVSSMYAFSLYESYDFPGAAATATVLLVVSLVVLVGFEIVSHRAGRRG
jgi:sulfate transport system permease protein